MSNIRNHSLRFALTAICALNVLCAITASAQTTSAELVAKTLRAAYPATRIDSVRPAPLPGLFEVAMGDKIAYTDSTGEHFLFGHIFNMRTQQDLTAARLTELARIDPALLREAVSLRSKTGAGHRTLYVFADTNCGYCRTLERTLQDLPDATIHVVPVALLGPDSATKAAAVLCAKDPPALWRTLMLTGGAVSGGEACVSKVDQNNQLALKLGVEGTPTLFSSDGRRLAGARTLPELTAWLDQINAAPVATAQR